MTMTDEQTMLTLLAVSVALEHTDNAETARALRSLRDDVAAQVVEQRNRWRPKPRRPLMQRVDSFTDPDKAYTVERGTDGEWTCTCPDYFYRTHKDECKHIRRARNASRFTFPTRSSTTDRE